MNRITRILETRTGGSQRPIGWRLLSTLSAGVLVLGLGVAQAAPEVGAEPAAKVGVSPQSRDAKADYAIIEERILSAIEAGELSANDARTTLAALRRTMFPERRRSAAGSDVRQRSRDTDMDPRSRYAAAEKKARAAVKAGDISSADAKKRLMEYRKRLGEEARRADKREAPQGDEIKRYLAAQKKIKAAVEAGDLSREEAEKKLAGLRRRIEKKSKELEGLRAAERKEKNERRR